MHVITWFYKRAHTLNKLNDIDRFWKIALFSFADNWNQVEENFSNLNEKIKRVKAQASFIHKRGNWKSKRKKKKKNQTGTSMQGNGKEKPPVKK